MAGEPRPVIIQYEDGRQYEIPGGAAVAKEFHPDAKITHFSDDMSEYVPQRQGSTPAENAQIRSGPEAVAVDPPVVVEESDGNSQG